MRMVREKCSVVCPLAVLDKPLGRVSVKLEQILTNNKFIIGFANVILEYTTDCGRNECVLIEVKSRLHDLAACLRQLRAYAEYIPAVTKMYVVHCDDTYEPYSESEIEMRRFFASQGIYVANFNSPFHNPNYSSVPTGRRLVEIEYAEPNGYSFDVYLAADGFDEHGRDAKTQIFLFGYGDLDKIRPFSKFVGVNVDQWYCDWSLKPFREMIGVKLLLDVEHSLGASDNTAGYAEETYTAVHTTDLSRSFALD
jgi:hypothetical protein